MVSRRTLGFAALSMVLVLAACKTVDEKQAMKDYLTKAQTLSQSMGDTGTRFEKLMTTHADMTKWTNVEKTELKTTRDAMAALRDQAKALTVPAALTDVHPLLVKGLTEITDTMDTIGQISANPSSITPDMATTMQAKANQAQTDLNEYLQKLEKVVQEKYPDLMKEI